MFYPACLTVYLSWNTMTLKCEGGWAVDLDGSVPASSPFPRTTQQVCLALPCFTLPCFPYPTLPMAGGLRTFYPWRRCWPHLHLLLFTSGRGPAGAEPIGFLMCCLHPNHQSLLPVVSSPRVSPGAPGWDALPQPALPHCWFIVAGLSWHSNLAVYKGLLNTWNLFTMW